jgi:hypothetical protein
VSANGLHQVRNDRRGRAAGLVAAHPAGVAASDGKAVVAGRGASGSIAADYGSGSRQPKAGPMSATPRSSGLMPISDISEIGGGSGNEGKKPPAERFVQPTSTSFQNPKRLATCFILGSGASYDQAARA